MNKMAAVLIHRDKLNLIGHMSEYIQLWHSANWVLYWILSTLVMLIRNANLCNIVLRKRVLRHHVTVNG